MQSLWVSNSKTSKIADSKSLIFLLSRQDWRRPECLDFQRFLHEIVEYQPQSTTLVIISLIQSDPTKKKGKAVLRQLHTLNWLNSRWPSIFVSVRTCELWNTLKPEIQAFAADFSKSIYGPQDISLHILAPKLGKITTQIHSLSWSRHNLSIHFLNSNQLKFARFPDMTRSTPTHSYTPTQIHSLTWLNQDHAQPLYILFWTQINSSSAVCLIRPGGHQHIDIHQLKSTPWPD